MRSNPARTMRPAIKPRLPRSGAQSADGVIGLNGLIVVTTVETAVETRNGVTVGPTVCILRING